MTTERNGNNVLANRARKHSPSSNNRESSDDSPADRRKALINNFAYVKRRKPKTKVILAASSSRTLNTSSREKAVTARTTHKKEWKVDSDRTRANSPASEPGDSQPDSGPTPAGERERDNPILNPHQILL